MRLICDKDTLLDGLQTAGRAQPGTAKNMPILSTTLFEARNNRLYLTATDLQLTIRCQLPANVDANGSLAVPHRIITDLVHNIPDESCELNIPDGNHTLHFASETTRTMINSANPGDYPPIADIGDTIPLLFPAKTLSQAAARVAICADASNNRPILAGVAMQIKNSSFTLAATDGLRLATHEGQLLTPAEEPVEIVIPLRAIKEMIRHHYEDEDEITIHVNRDRHFAAFRTRMKTEQAAAEVLTQLIQGTYPQYQEIIPTKATTEIALNPDSLKTAIKCAGIFTDEESPQLQLEVETNPNAPRLTISGQSESNGSSCNEIQPDQILAAEGEPISIAFSRKYLLEAVNSIGDQEATIRLNSPTEPALFRIRGSEDYHHVVMPMFNKPPEE